MRTERVRAERVRTGRGQPDQVPADQVRAERARAEPVRTERSRLFERIYALVRRIPPGRVATYGQIAGIVGCSARVAGYAMAATPDGEGVPWQRVINSRGEISLRPGDGASRQRELLDAEGVRFNPAGRVDFSESRWSGPGWEWLEQNGYDPGA